VQSVSSTNVSDTVFQNTFHHSCCVQIRHLIYRALTYSKEQSPWKTNRFLASQEIPHILWNPKVHYSGQSARHLSLSWATSIQSIPSIPIPENPS
jgi:hypothetical protein